LQPLEIRETRDIACNQQQVAHGSDHCDLGIRVGRGSARWTESGTLFSLPLRGALPEVDDWKDGTDASEEIIFDLSSALARG